MRKITILNRYLFTFAIILAFSVLVFAQTEMYSVAAKWSFYAATEDKVSFMMPRLPVLIDDSDSCRGQSIKDYYAYNDGAVYSVRIISKVKPSRFCSDKKKFGKKSFSERVNKLKNELEVEINLTDISAKSEIKLSGKEEIVKLINDFENDRWFELSVFGADESKSDVERFLNSFAIEEPVTGITIGQGAEQVYGDDVPNSIVEDQIKNDKGVVETIKKLLVKTENNETRAIKVIKKPRAAYTEMSQQMQIQGKVVLRVTFTANGAVGNITIISGLGAGLTEESIKAARKIAFIPAQKDGARYSVTKPVEYTFTIY